MMTADLNDEDLERLAFKMKQHVFKLKQEHNVTPGELPSKDHLDDAVYELLDAGNTWKTLVHDVLELASHGAISEAQKILRTDEERLYTSLSNAQKRILKSHGITLNHYYDTYGINTRNNDYPLTINDDLNGETKHIYYVIAGSLLINDANKALA